MELPMGIMNVSIVLKIIVYILLINRLNSLETGTGEIKEEYINHTFPKTINLLNNKILMINNDGIYLYSSELGDESLQYNISSTIEDVEKAELKQFSNDDEGYVIIILQEKLLFFNSDGNYYHECNLKMYSSFYSLTPYKKYNNYLYYIICAKNETEYIFNLYYYKFNLDTKLNEIINTNSIDVNETYNSENIKSFS